MGWVLDRKAAVWPGKFTLKLSFSDAHIQRRDELRLAKQRLADSLANGVAVCLDLGLCDHMSSKELGKLSSQIRRLYGINRKTQVPLDLNLINFKQDSLLYQDCVARNQGFESYQVRIFTLHLLSSFPMSDAAVSRRI